jgi:hypothetical protein
MNIISRKTAASDVDPFSVSDRTPIGKRYGKGDKPRTTPNSNFRSEFDRIFRGRRSKSVK